MGGVWVVGWMGGLICGSMEITWGQHEDNVETTWRPQLCGDHMGTLWRQHGDSMSTMWIQHGENIGTTGMWRQYGGNVETTWGQHGDHRDVETTWGQHGDNMGTT